jgi:hypothetical protein
MPIVNDVVASSGTNCSRRLPAARDNGRDLSFGLRDLPGPTTAEKQSAVCAVDEGCDC